MLTGAFILLISLAGSDGNLLLNPGFEDGTGGQPENWSLFVMPKPGAEGRLDDQVFCEGKRAAMLRNTEAYPDEPANNWSQNIVKDLAEKTLIIGGLVKTENASGADIWLQCWRRKPWGVLHVARTGDASPVSESKDWTPVAMKVVVPKETDFVTLRCVLKGRGAAWFDDLRVLDATADESVDRQVKALSEDLLKGKGKSAPKDAVKKDILRETESLTATMRALKETNDGLRKELSQVREDLDDLRRGLDETRRDAAASSSGKAGPLPESKSGRRAPPLVPHGYDLKELPDAG